MSASTNGSVSEGPVDHGGSPSRRQFLKSAVAAATVATAAQPAPADAAAADEEPKLPQIALGKHQISRLICGANCFNAGSHLSVFVNRQMREYYTPDQIVKTLKRCLEVGINAFQSHLVNEDVYRRVREEGGNLRFISLGRDTDDDHLRQLAELGTIGVAHHGEVTDNLFKSGQFDKLNEYLKRVRDSGMLVGVSTHMPDVVDAVESKGWDVDFYMTCVYERHRSAEELRALLGHVPIPVREVYLTEDPPRMFKAIRQTRRPCLAFKILAAGRLSDRPEWVERAFKETFESIKPTDGVIVGIYDRYSDQPAECAALVRKYG
ncbi:MAG: twin-arginine translocation signal domain-containing protein [Thermoguttaceae bacterium]|jgi:hypothetical protein|nr:twin-arginine translocation signal domain-containing protein [Thermoguttaceae bacterium]